MKSAVTVFLLSAVACSGGGSDGPPPPPPPPVQPTDTGGPPPVDTGTGPVVDPNGPIVDTCPAASAAFANLDIVGAKAAYQECITADPDNAGAYVGLAWTELALLPDRSAFTDALARCGERTDLVDVLYGSNGQVAVIGERFEGTSAVDVDFLDNDGVTDLDAFDDPRIVFSEVRPTSSDDDGPGDSGRSVELRDTLLLTIASSFSYEHEVQLSLDLTDVYRDGTNQALAPGLQIAVTELPFGALRVATPCGQPGSACNGFLASSYPFEGTIDVVQFGANEGDLVELSIAARIPATCEGDVCSDRFALDGTVTDTLSGELDTSWLPFSGEFASSCDTRDCGRTRAYVDAFERCTFEDHLAVHELAGDVANELRTVADAFARAGEERGRHEVRFEEVVWIGEALPFNTGEMEAIASALYAASGAVRLASSYDILDPSGVPADLVGDYRGPDSAFDEELGPVCVDVDYYGLPVEEAADQLAAHLLQISAAEDLAGVRQDLLDAFTKARDAVSSSDGETELYDFAFASSWAIELLTELSMVIASLEGTDGTLPNAPGWRVTLDDFFDAPTDRATLLAVADGTQLVVTDGTCEQDVFFDEGAAQWMAENGFGALQIPQSALESDGLGKGDGPWPLLLDVDRYEELEDPATGDPVIFTEPLLEIVR